MSGSSNDGGIPSLTKLLEQMRLPGIDIQAMMEARRKDIEAVVQANRIAFQGAQALAQRQAELMQQAMSEWQNAAQGLTGKDLGQSATAQADFARQAFDKALANMRELAEMASKSQSDAYEVIKQRMHENMEQFRGALQRKE